MKVHQHSSSPLCTDGTSANPEVSRDYIRESFWLSPMVHLDGAVKIISVHRAGDTDTNPAPGKNFSRKLT